MKVVVQMTEVEEAKALRILLRHSPGTVLSNGTYVIDQDAAKKLKDAGIEFRELSPNIEHSQEPGVPFPPHFSRTRLNPHRKTCSCSPRPSGPSRIANS